jgi:hypothetical protein
MDTDNLISEEDQQLMSKWLIDRKEQPFNITFKELEETQDLTLKQKLGISYTIGNMMGSEKVTGRIVRHIIEIAESNDKDDS